jgi:hypothetical protein
MSTPFDMVVRIERRNVDGLRVAIQGVVGEIDRLASARDQLDARRRSECISAEEDWRVSTYHWLRARSRDAMRITNDQHEQEDRLAQLRERAGAAYGALRTVENAAERHRAEVARQRTAQEQAEADDLSNVRRLLAQRRARVRALTGGTR